jgi:uncharacterized cupredoxin-like copper-binding protein
MESDRISRRGENMKTATTTIFKLMAMALLVVGAVSFLAACGGSGAEDTGPADDVAEHVDDDATDGVEDDAAADDHDDAAADDHDDGDDHDDAAADDHDDGDDHDDADGSSSASTVHVTLSEWGVTGAHDNALSASSGAAVFEIHNDGVAPHDLKIVKTDLSPDALPLSEGLVDMDAAGELFGGVDPIPGGEIVVESGYELVPGDYVLLCSIPGHYQQGMFAQLTVE